MHPKDSDGMGIGVDFYQTTLEFSRSLNYSLCDIFLEGGFSRITILWNTLIQVLFYHDLTFFSLKMCHKNFENWFTNKHLMSKDVFE